jgi:hypothetical protein
MIKDLYNEYYKRYRTILPIYDISLKLYIDVRLARTLFVAPKIGTYIPNDNLEEWRVMHKWAIEHDDQIRMLLEILSDNLIYNRGYRIESIEESYKKKTNKRYFDETDIENNVNSETFEYLYGVFSLVCNTTDEERGIALQP